MIRLKIANLNKRFRLNEDFVKALVRDVVRHVAMRGGELSIVFLGRKGIQGLNRKFRREDSSTDVISFHMDDREVLPKMSFGDVFISLDAAKENARIFNSSFERELVLYIIHGILHLSGYDDERPRDRARMRKKENEILAHICKARDLSKVLIQP